MSSEENIQYVSTTDGTPLGVIVPIELWREITSERETAYLLGNEVMHARLLAAKESNEVIPLDEARAELGI